jgi:HlyD family secretion protein
MKRIAIAGVLLLAALAGWAGWHYSDAPRAIVAKVVEYFWGPTLPPGFASGNGRIEATQYDIAAKHAGRIAEVLIREGDMVAKGQVLARIDTKDLEADLRQAEAQLAQTREDLRRAIATVTQRESDVRRADAAIAQRQSDILRADAAIVQHESELVLAKQDVDRAEPLLGPGAINRQEFDQYVTKRATAEAVLAQARAAKTAAEAALVEAHAQRQVADAALATARIDIDFRQRAIDAGVARVQRIQTDIDDSQLATPIPGRVLYKVAEPGEVLPAGGKVVTVLDLSDVYMTVFLPTEKAGRLRVGAEGRIVLDARPDLVIPASVSFVAPRSQFTPKEVETRSEREKLTFRVKLQIPADLLRSHLEDVKTGLPGVGYARLDPSAPWPAYLQVKLPP